MGQISNMIIGAIAMAFGVVLIFVITPTQVIEAFFATVEPNFYPDFCAAMLIASGFALFVSGLLSPAAPIDWQAFRQHGAVFVVSAVLLCGAALLTPVVGFLPVGAAVAAITLLLMRQRLDLLFAAIVIGAPLAVWVLFDQILERPLP